MDLIIRKTVSSNLEKVREVVKGMKYSESPGTNASETGTIQTPAIK
nr:hypothetical protein [Borrelia persica]